MVIVFLMSNSSIGVCVCDHVLVFQCLCVHRSEAQQQQRGESQKSPVINVIDARCVCVCLCACLLPSQHSAGVPSLLSETHHSLPRQQWTSPRLCLCECAYVHVGVCERELWLILLSSERLSSHSRLGNTHPHLLPSLSVSLSPHRYIILSSPALLSPLPPRLTDINSSLILDLDTWMHYLPVALIRAGEKDQSAQAAVVLMTEPGRQIERHLQRFFKKWFPRTALSVMLTDKIASDGGYFNWCVQLDCALWPFVLFCSETLCSWPTV